MRHSNMHAMRLLPVVAMLAAAAPSAARPTAEKSFAFVADHDPEKVVYALKYGADVVRAKGHFRLYLGGGRSVLMFVPVYKKAVLVQREYRKIRARAPGIRVIACKEVVDRIKKMAKAPYVPFLPGVRVSSCKGVKQKMLREGWRPALGL